MLTDFGKECRILRIKNNQNLGDMAEKLGVKSSFLSAIENGKKNIPKDFCEKIKKEYGLSHEAYKKFIDAADSSKTQIKIQMQNMDQGDRDLVISFARKFETLTPKKKEEILEILRGNQSE